MDWSSLTLLWQTMENSTMAKELAQFTKRYVILKGYENDNDEMGMIVLDKQENTIDMVYNDKVNYVSHGTGDVFASSFVGSVMLGKSPSSAAKVAGEFTKKAIELTNFKVEYYGKSYWPFFKWSYLVWGCSLCFRNRSRDTTCFFISN